jgi:hypothetical protein
MEDKFHTRYQGKVKSELCSIHQMRPSLKFENGMIVLKCCCLGFKMQCYKIISDALSTYKKDLSSSKLKES